MGRIGFADVTTAQATKGPFNLGDIYSEGEVDYQYFHANGALSQYGLITADADFEAAPGTTTTSGARPTRCAIPQIAVADNEYFWAPIGPFPESKGFKVKGAASCAADVKLYTTATAGVVDDTATDLVEGLVLTETLTSAAAATCEAVKRLVTNCQD